MRVIMVRHGESCWNLEQRYQGQQDSGLTACGRAQAAQVADLLADQVGRAGAVWSSDLPRARDTAAAYAGRVDLPVSTDRRLREVDIGTWAGRALAEVARAEPDVVAAAASGHDVRRGGGETFAEARARVVDCLTDIAHDRTADQDDAPVVVFSHGGAIRVAAAHAAGVPSPGHDGMGPPSNCSRTVLELSRERAALIVYNVPLPSARGVQERAQGQQM